MSDCLNMFKQEFALLCFLWKRWGFEIYLTRSATFGLKGCGGALLLISRRGAHPNCAIQDVAHRPAVYSILPV